MIFIIVGYPQCFGSCLPVVCRWKETNHLSELLLVKSLRGFIESLTTFGSPTLKHATCGDSGQTPSCRRTIRAAPAQLPLESD